MRIFCQETISGMNRVGIAYLGSANDPIDL